MRRIPILMAVGMAATVWIGGARAEREALPPTPEALRELDGTLYGEVERVQRDTSFTGLVLKVSLVETASGGLAPVQVPGMEGARVALAVPLGSNGRALDIGLNGKLRRLAPGDPVRVEAHADGPEHTLYLRSIVALSEPPPSLPTDRPADAGSVTPPPSPYAPPAPDDTPSPDEVQHMAKELQTMRRELARLQQDVADLRAVAADLSQRGR